MSCILSFSRNRRALLEKLKMLDKNPKLVNTLSKKAHERVKKHYTWDQVINKYEKVFKTLKRK